MGLSRMMASMARTSEERGRAADCRLLGELANGALRKRCHLRLGDRFRRRPRRLKRVRYAKRDPWAAIQGGIRTASLSPRLVQHKGDASVLEFPTRHQLYT